MNLWNKKKPSQANGNGHLKVQDIEEPIKLIPLEELVKPEGLSYPPDSKTAKIGGMDVALHPSEKLSYVCHFTPAQVEHIVKNFLNHQRPITKDGEEKIAYLQDQMLSGKWRVTSEAISFHKDGKRLVNGQHTMLAAFRARLGLIVRVVINLEDADVNSLDQPKKRSLSNTFSMNDIKRYSDMSIIVKLVYIYHIHPQRNIVMNEVDHNAMIEAYFSNEEEYIEAVDYVRDELKKSKSKPSFPFTSLCFMRYMTNHHEKSKPFMESLINQSEEDTLFKRVNEERINLQDGGTKLSKGNNIQYQTIHLLIDCWNYFINEDKTANFKVNRKKKEILPDFKWEKSNV